MVDALSRPGPLATASLSVVTLTAFAANSLLCRGALGPRDIDPVGFTLLRLTSGTAVLYVVVWALRRSKRRVARAAGSWKAGLALFAYALGFSFAYLSIDAGTGALILFAAVQITMLGDGIRRGEHPTLLEWAGLSMAMAGLVYLLRPGRVAPDLPGSLLMALAGVAWGVYSILGRGAADPVAATAGNFARSLPFIVPAALVGARGLSITTPGAVLALASGALASGLGYVVWYAALRGLTNAQAAVIQLAVPLLAAFGGVLFLAESPTMRLWIAAVVILGGVGLVIAARKR